MSSIVSLFSKGGGSRKSNASNSSGVSWINLSEIIELRRGIQTEVFMKAKLIDPSCCFSIVTPSRSLDLTLRSAVQRDRIVRGIRVILEQEGVDVRIL